MAQNNEQKPVLNQNTIIIAIASLLLGGGGHATFLSGSVKEADIIKMQANQENIIRTLSKIEECNKEIKEDNKKTLNSMILTIQSNKSEINDIKWQLKALKTASK